MNKIKKGFTLIEMLIVVVIIGILAAALIPRLQGIQGRARDTARRTHLAEVGKGAAVFKADKGNYTGMTGGSLVPTYMTSIPSDPQFTTTPAEFSTAMGVGYGMRTFCASDACLILGAVTETPGSSSNATSGAVGSLTGTSTIADGQNLICTGTVSATAGSAPCGTTAAANLRYYYVQ